MKYNMKSISKEIDNHNQIDEEIYHNIDNDIS